MALLDGTRTGLGLATDAVKVAALLVSLVVGLCVFSGSSEAAGSASLIVFSVEGDLFTIAPDGTDLRELGDIDAYRPRWSPRGWLIAFESAGIWFVRSDGTRVHRLTRPAAGKADLSPAWSPRGDTIAFEREGLGLWTIRPGGGSAKQLLSPATAFVPSDWSPDGRRILGSRGDPGRLWIVNADGANLRRLGPKSLVASAPRWSPDGARVALVDADAGAVRVLRLATNRVRTVFEPEPETYDVDFGDWSLAWSPDGRSLAVMQSAAVSCVDDPTTEWCEQATIWIVDTARSTAKKIYAGPLAITAAGLDWTRGR